MPRGKKKKESDKLMEEEGIEELIDLETLELKKSKEEMSSWDKLRVVLFLDKQGYMASDIAEKLGVKVITIREMRKLKRDNLRSRGFDPDKIYKFIKEGASLWSIIDYLTYPEFKEIVELSETTADFNVRFKDLRSIPRIKAKLTHFKLTVEDFLKLYLLNDYSKLLKARVNLNLNEPFILVIQPVKGKFYVGEDNRIKLALWMNDEEEPIVVGEDGITKS